MADEPQQYSVPDFAGKIRAKFPGAYDQIPDDDLVVKWLKVYPTYAKNIIPVTGDDTNAKLPEAFTEPPAANSPELKAANKAADAANDRQLDAAQATLKDKATGFLKGLQSGAEALPGGQRLGLNLKIKPNDITPRQAGGASLGQWVGGGVVNTLPYFAPFGLGSFLGPAVNAAYGAAMESNRQLDLPKNTAGVPSLNKKGIAAQALVQGATGALLGHLPLPEQAQALPRFVRGGITGGIAGGVAGAAGPTLQQLTDSGRLTDPRELERAALLNAAIMGVTHGLTSTARGGPRPAPEPPDLSAATPYWVAQRGGDQMPLPFTPPLTPKPELPELPWEQPRPELSPKSPNQQQPDLPFDELIRKSPTDEIRAAHPEWDETQIRNAARHKENEDLGLPGWLATYLNNLEDNNSGFNKADLLAHMGGASAGALAGAALDPDDRTGGALMGAAGGLLATHAALRVSAGQMKNLFRAFSDGTAIGEKGTQTHGIKVEAEADRARKLVLFGRTLNEVRPIMDGLPQETQDLFTDIIEHPSGGIHALPAVLQPVAGAIQGIYRDLYTQIKALGGLQSVADFDDHWLGRKWKNRGQVPLQTQQMIELLGSLHGTNAAPEGYGFNKPRTFLTMAEGRRRNLEPATGLENPVDMAQYKIREMTGWIANQEALRAMEREHLAIRVPPNTPQSQIPNGWVPPPMRVASNVYVNPGAYKALEIWNSKGLADDPITATVKNGLLRWTMAKLAVSGFHLMTTSEHAAGVKAGSAISEAAQGEGTNAATRLIQMAYAPIDYWLKGKAFTNRVYLNPNESPASNQALADFIRSGQSVNLDDFYKTQSISKFIQNMKAHGGGLPGAARAAVADPANAATAAFEAPTRAIMQHVVQPIKVGIQLERNELARRGVGPNAPTPLLRHALQEQMSANDDMMGQMNYRNLQIPKKIRDAAMLTTTAPGWNYGTARTAIGGPLDLLKMPLRVRQGLPALSPRTANLLGLGVAVPATSALYQYLHTGLPLESAQDAVAPRTGATDAEGNPERVIVPNYLSRDIASFQHDPLGTVAGKINPGAQEITDIIRNKDWRGTQIYDPRAGAGQIASQVGTHLLRQVLPISAGYARRYLPERLQSFVEAPTRERIDTGPESRLEEALGVNAAPKWMTRDPVIQEALELQARHYPQTRTLTQQAHMDDRRVASTALRSGNGAAVGELLAERRLRPEDVLQLAKQLPPEQRLEALLRGLEPEELLQIFQDNPNSPFQMILKKNLAMKLTGKALISNELRQQILDVLRAPMKGQ